MNVIERDAARAAGSASEQPDKPTAPEPTERRKLRPLLSLMPYLARYRWRAIAALVVLVIAAITTLVVPIAVRRMIDFGFVREGASLIDSYFTVLIGIVAVLALSSAARFYLVTTLGERMVADLRESVFGHLISLSPAYFDAAKTGELISRLTADTTQIKAAVGASISVALRNVVLFVGASAMMVVTSPRLSAFVLAAIPVIVLPLYGFGRAVRRRSRAAQDTLADATAYASELLGAVRVLQAFTNEALANSRFGAAVERAFVAARDSIRARAILTAIAIFLVFASVVVVLWVGAQDVLAGRMSAGRLSQFVLYAVFAAAGLGQLSEVWGEISQASGAAERLFEILRVRPVIVPPARPAAQGSRRRSRNAGPHAPDVRHAPRRPSSRGSSPTGTAPRSTATKKKGRRGMKSRSERGLPGASCSTGPAPSSPRRKAHTRGSCSISNASAPKPIACGRRSRSRKRRRISTESCSWTRSGASFSSKRNA